MRSSPRKFDTEEELYAAALRALMRRAHSIHEMREYLARRSNEPRASIERRRQTPRARLSRRRALRPRLRPLTRTISPPGTLPHRARAPVARSSRPAISKPLSMSSSRKPTNPASFRARLNAASPTSAVRSISARSPRSTRACCAPDSHRTSSAPKSAPPRARASPIPRRSFLRKTDARELRIAGLSLELTFPNRFSPSKTVKYRHFHSEGNEE